MKIFIYSLLVAVLVLHAQACDNSPCTIRCRYGLKVDKDGCSLCECQEEECFNLPEACEPGTVCKVFDLTSYNKKVAKCISDKYPESCQAPRDIGPCKALKPSWYFDPEAGTCKEFSFGGCMGNENRFRTQKSCENSCNQGSASEECSPVTCMMFCENGFKKDKRGCDLCECAMGEEDFKKLSLHENKNKAKAEALTSCRELKCEKTCPLGYQKDPEGCDMCRCKVECPTNECQMACEFGFQTDADQCEICACKGDPNCMLADCGEPCPGGRKLDDGGCEMCECVEGGGCPEEACLMECPFGLRKDRYGCQVCECNEDPCDRIQCQEDEVCKINENKEDPNNPPAKCVDPYMPSDCKDTMCAMFCEFGFKRDKFGCEVCECQASEKKPCGASHYCRMWCQYGYVYQENGCRNCTCLPDPCLEKANICDPPRVCEAFKNCVDSYCPARPRCIDPDRVKRIGVNMTFIHDPIPEEFDFSALKRPVHEHLAKLFGVTYAEIKSVEIVKKDDKSLAIAFHLVRNATAKVNLVDAYDNFKTKIDTLEEPVPMPYEGIDFVPVAQGITAKYSSSSNIPRDNGGSGNIENKGNTQMIIIIVCAVVGGLILVAVIAALVMSKAKKSSSESQKKVKYEAAATDDNQEEVKVTNA